MSGILYVVATPIGNLEDISKRALRIFSEVDLIAAEDTRHTRKLLTHYGLSGKLLSYHEHNERAQAPILLKKLEAGETIALVTDAGTPTISDPGYRLVRLCRENGLPVVPIPGPSSVTAALSASGLPSDQFYFAGFLPNKAGKKRRLLEDLGKMSATVIFFESPYRLVKSLQLMQAVLGNRRCVVAREVSKRYEEFVSGSLGEVIEMLSRRKIKGEIVILLAGVGKE